MSEELCIGVYFIVVVALLCIARKAQVPERSKGDVISMIIVWPFLALLAVIISPLIICCLIGEFFEWAGGKIL